MTGIELIRGLERDGLLQVVGESEGCSACGGEGFLPSLPTPATCPCCGDQSEARYPVADEA